MPTSNVAAANNANQIQWTLLQLIGFPTIDLNAQPLKHALDQAGIYGFNSDFISLSTDDVMTLKHQLHPLKLP